MLHHSPLSSLSLSLLFRQRTSISQVIGQSVYFVWRERERRQKQPEGKIWIQDVHGKCSEDLVSEILSKTSNRRGPPCESISLISLSSFLLFYLSHTTRKAEASCSDRNKLSLIMSRLPASTMTERFHSSCAEYPQRPQSKPFRELPTLLFLKADERNK